MNINSISVVAPSTVLQSTSAEIDSQNSQLMNQVAEIQKQISDVSVDKTLSSDAKTKRTQELNRTLAQILVEIDNLRSSKGKNEVKTEEFSQIKPKIKEKDENYTQKTGVGTFVDENI